MVWKKVNNSDAGTATKHGGNDIDKIADALNGVNVSDPMIYNITFNTLKDSTNAAGDLLKGNATKYVRWAKGGALQQIRVNTAGTDLEWFTANDASNPFVRKYGQFTAGQFGAVNGSGFLANAIVAFGGTSSSSIDADGRYATYPTTTTANSSAGLRSVSAITRRAFNPYHKIKVRINTAVTNSRAFFGLSSSATAPVTDDQLSALSGVALGWRSTDTNWQLMINDGSGATAFTDTTIATSTSIWFVEVLADAAANSFAARLYNSAGTLQYSNNSITSNIPASTTNLTMMDIVSNSTTTEKFADIYAIQFDVDK